MRIAIATDGNSVSSHFGRCPLYTVIDVNDGEIIERHILENPGHRPNFLPEFLYNNQVDCIVSGGMGQRARTLFEQYNIEAIVGVAGEIDTVIDDVLGDALENGENLCHPEHSHHNDEQKHCH